MNNMLAAFLAAMIAMLTSIVIHAAAQPSRAPGSGHGFLIDKHVSANLNCGACHTESPPRVAPQMASCLTCHGGTYEKLAGLTASDQPNPHASHQGPIPCSSCHHVHSASQTLCNSCHNFDMATP